MRLFSWGAALVALIPAVAAAQSATMRGTVRALSGRPLAAVSVLAEGNPAATVSDSAGHFVLSIPAAHATRLVIQIAGYASETLTVAPIPAGITRTIAVTVAPLAQLEVQQIVVLRDRPLLNTSDAATGGAIERAELQALPTDARDPVTLAYTIPGVAQARTFFGDAPKLSIGGANALYTTYTPAPCWRTIFWRRCTDTSSMRTCRAGIRYISSARGANTPCSLGGQ